MPSEYGKALGGAPTPTKGQIDASPVKEEAPGEATPPSVENKMGAAHNSKIPLLLRALPDGPVISIPPGRETETAKLLLRRGPAGFTSGEASPLGWARRTSAYVCSLRKRGVPIATRREKTADGTSVGRYLLSAPVEQVTGSQMSEGAQ